MPTRTVTDRQVRMGPVQTGASEEAPRRTRSLYIVWRGYQRRAEVLAPCIGSELVFLPHRWTRRALRPLDYVQKFVHTARLIRRRKPERVFFQAPPHLSALPALMLGVPYVVDGHNALFQSVWGKLPLVGLVLRRASLVLVHNHEILRIAQKLHPDVTFHVLPDPIERIAVRGARRRPNQVLFICSFDPDEPVEVVIEVIESMPDVDFVLTANIDKLNSIDQRRLRSCSNLRMTGYVSTEAFHALLCSSAAAVALTTKEATQQSGACEALSSDTPAVISRDPLSEALYGSWAELVDNSAESVMKGIRAACGRSLNLASERTRWNLEVSQSVLQLMRTL